LQLERVGEHEGHDRDSPEAAEHALGAGPLREHGDVVDAGRRRDEQERVGVPGVALEA